jgi:L,D-peptidoglycan transpeptidase YkuD (ErfK/YbiS/YcfS/YnhG family)
MAEFLLRAAVGALQEQPYPTALQPLPSRRVAKGRYWPVNLGSRDYPQKLNPLVEQIRQIHFNAAAESKLYNSPQYRDHSLRKYNYLPIH